MYLLDTMVISELQKKVVNPQVATWLGAHDSREYFLSVITLGEIQKGICREEKINPQFSKRLKHWKDELEKEFNFRILPITNEIALQWGIISYRTGNSTIDNLIAATAKVHDLTVATRNIKHFEKTGVPCVNPWE